MAIGKEQIGRRMRRFEEVCRRHGLRLTHQRMEIFREVAGSDEHPDAETIYRGVHRRIPAVSMDTVYRTLAVLEAHGLVRKTEAQSGPARYDANADRHHHFICTRCGLVRDVYSHKLDKVSVPAAVKAIGTVTSCEVQLRGICAGCAKRKRNRNR